MYDGQPLQPSDKPWFCFWNSTINEFFIYLEEEAHPTSTTSNPKAAIQTGSPTGLITPFVSVPTQTTTNMLLQELTMSVSATAVPTSFAAYNPVYSAAATTSINKRDYIERRDYGSSAPNMTNYPKLIKMVEKRKPADTNALHVKPYCQKMQILDDWKIVPIPAVETVCIEEVQFPTSSAKPNKLLKRDNRDVVADLESYCICEWTSQ